MENRKKAILYIIITNNTTRIILKRNILMKWIIMKNKRC